MIVSEQRIDTQTNKWIRVQPRRDVSLTHDVDPIMHNLLQNETQLYNIAPSAADRYRSHNARQLLTPGPLASSSLISSAVLAIYTNLIPQEKK